MRVDRRLARALWLALCFHGPLTAAGIYRYSYDAEVHLFMADHYRRSWFGLWDPRWFGGFSVDSYPPLVHQLLALLGLGLGPERAFGALLLLTLLALPAAVWRFARVFVSRSAAGAAALAAVFLPGMALAANDFGQLPTLVGLLLGLLLVGNFARFLVRGGGPRAVGLIAALAASTTASHHATTLLFVPAAALACLIAVLGAGARVGTTARRSAVAVGAAVAAATAVVPPFWWWVLHHSRQTPIPHLSRADFLTSWEAQDAFFWAIYGVLPALAAYGLWIALGRRGSRARRAGALAGLALVLGVLGLGGTTPAPRLLFGAEWAWLTYDRFALWAAVALLPLGGVGLDDLLRRRSWLARGVAGGALAGLALYATLGALIAMLGPTQPYQADVRPIVAFLAQGDRTRWRYQTFGFGDTVLRLGRLVDAATMDGGYYTARRLPELTTIGIGQIDYALWWDPSGAALRRILARSGADAVRWAFVREPQYDSYLRAAGFHPAQQLDGGIVAWERPDTPPLPPDALAFGDPDLAGILWGTLPPLSLVATLTLLAADRSRHGALARRWQPSFLGAAPFAGTKLGRNPAPALPASGRPVWGVAGAEPLGYRRRGASGRPVEAE